MKAEALFMHLVLHQLCEQTFDSAEKNSPPLDADSQLANLDHSEPSKFFRLWRCRLIFKSYFNLGQLEEAFASLEKQEKLRNGGKPLESSIPLAAIVHELLRHKNWHSVTDGASHTARHVWHPHRERISLAHLGIARLVSPCLWAHQENGSSSRPFCAGMAKSLFSIKSSTSDKLPELNRVGVPELQGTYSNTFPAPPSEAFSALSPPNRTDHYAQW